MVKLELTYVLVFSLYFFTLLYGASVMRSVLEEKTTHIVEVIISAIKPHQLLLGKIIGVCSVCLTMFLIWRLCAILLLMNINPILGLFGIQELPPQFIEVTGIIKSTGASAFLHFLIYAGCETMNRQVRLYPIGTATALAHIPRYTTH